MSQKLKGIKAIFFDVADTLYINKELEKQYPLKLAELVSQERQVSVEDAERLLAETMKNLEGSEKHVTKVRAMRELGFSREQVHAAYAKVIPSQYLSSDSQLATMLSDLNTKYKLGIISNFKKAHLLGALASLGLDEHIFSFFVTEDIVQGVKPDPEPFLKAIEMAGCSASQCLYVGDSPSKDIRPAKEVGMATALVKDSAVEEDIEFADVHMASVKELTSFLE